MAKFAVILDDKVFNTIIADTKEIAEEVTGMTCVEYSDSDVPHIGFGYDGTTFAQPVAPTE